jgi:hypothetical protein
VVTDEDFGIAYWTRGYARRFLVELFQHNHVLFVGYSHSDTVLTYLARGLPFGTPTRYALTKESSVAKWNALGVEPIVFPSQEPQHEPLVEAFARWGRYVAWGLADHEREIARLVADGPDALDPQSSDYLQSRIEEQREIELGERVWFELSDVGKVLQGLGRRIHPGTHWGFNYEGDRAWVWAEAHVDLKALVDEARSMAG